MSTSPREPLNPFGIRELHGPSDHGIVRITAPEYDSTIKSYPNAALTYLDDDDGETITVGSSLELQQRLDEPLRARRRRERNLSASAARSPIDSDQKVHLFDIQRTAENLLVWRDHAAYSSKALHKNAGSITSLSEPGTETTSAANVAATHEDHADIAATLATERESNVTLHPRIDAPESSASSPKPLTCSNDILQSVDTILQSACQGIESHVTGFTAFLDLTASALRTVAQKTRDADTSPVEDLLGGMKDIIVEAGHMGKDLLRSLEDTEPHVPSQQDSRSRRDSSESAQPVFIHTVDDESLASSKRVSFAPTEPNSANHAQVPAPPVPQLDQEVESSIIPGPWSDIRPSFDALLPQTAPIFYRNLSKQASSSTRAKPTQLLEEKPSESLMDMEGSTADFAARYPPLTSLKRAKTLGSLRTEPSRADKHEETSSSTVSTLSRYPSLSQLEQHRHMTGTSRPRPREPTRLERHRAFVRAQYHRFDSLPKGYRTPSVEDATDLEDKPFENKAAGPAKPDGGVDALLPGAWPEPSTPGVNASVPESSGAFFNRMAQNGRSGQSQPKSPALSCRTTSPLADCFSPVNNNLRRAQTVTASNPAARLNGPFDPMTGVPDLRSEASTSQMMANAIPAMLPQRSLTQHQPTRTRQAPARPTVVAPQNTLWNNSPHSRQVPLSHRPIPLHRAPMPGAFPYPPIPQPRPVSGNNHFLRQMRSEPNFIVPTPAARPDMNSEVSDCVKSLRNMGYGVTDANEDARLPMYASATSSNVSEAIEMIEEDRRAAEAIMARR